MNAIFLTQSSSLEMFYSLMTALREPLALDRVGFFVSDSQFYHRFLTRCPEIESGRYHLLKEWEIVKNAREGELDCGRIRQYEESFGNPTLWGALLADRRVCLGEKCSLRQDYTPRFNRDQMLGILQEGLVAVEKFFDEVQPDVVVSFICVTFGEYLAYLFAQKRGIPFINLRPTRIKNYVTYGESVFEPSERIKAAYEEYLENGSEDQWTEEARDYLEFVRTGHGKYEGVIPPSRTPHSSEIAWRKWPGKFMDLLKEEYAYYFGEFKDDRHAVDWATSTLYRRILNPRRARKVNRKMGSFYVRQEDLVQLDYVFFPLHTEPEISLQVYSTPYLNQIETIRNISYAVPVGIELVVKDHPVSIGKRPLGYYEKLLEIPNVRMADPGLDSRALVENARLIATIAGSIGLEALMRGKPVVTFGRTPYGYLPNSMTRRIGRLDTLAAEIDKLLASHAHNERAVISFVAATMRESAQVNLYSNLLKKRGVYSPVQHDDDPWQQDIQALAQYTIGSI